MEKLLLVAIIVSPLRIFAIANPGGVTLSFFRLLVLLWAFFAFFSVLMTKSQHRSQKSFWTIMLLLTYLFSLFLTLIYSNQLFMGDTLTRFLVKITGCILIILTILFINDREFCLKGREAYIISGIIPIIFGLYQLYYFRIYKKFPILPFSTLNLATESGLGRLFGKLPRISSTFLEPNYFGQYLSILFIFTMSKLQEGGKRQIILILYLLIILIELIYTFSISAAFGFICGLIVYILANRKLINNKLVKTAQFFIPIMIIAYVMFFTSFGIESWQAILFRLETRSTAASTLFGRAVYFNASAAAIADSPVLGVGFGGLFRYIPSSKPIATGHSALLTVFAEQGLLGFLPLFGLFVYVWSRLAKFTKTFSRQASTKAWSYAAIAGSFVSLFVANLAYDAMFSFDSSWCLLMLAVLAATIKPEQSSQD